MISLSIREAGYNIKCMSVSNVWILHNNCDNFSIMYSHYFSKKQMFWHAFSATFQLRTILFTKKVIKQYNQGSWNKLNLI